MTMSDFCMLADCQYTAGGSGVSCAPGGSDCTSAYLQAAYKSDFHDDDLRDLTEEINEKLHKLSKKPPFKGARLSFLWSPRGVFLAWVKHSDTPASDGTKRSDGIEENDRALKLYPHPYHPGF